MSQAAASPRPSRFTPEQLAAAEIMPETELPDLKALKPANVPLQNQYWSPESEGESKIGWILGIDYEEIADMETGELKLSECVFFVEQTHDDKKARFHNASKILIAYVKGAIRRGEIIPGNTLYPVKITYLGKKKNRSNQRMSGRWEILPLVINP